jgi:TRAP-type C4-dicarboxylate transport system permease small subunit
VADTVPTPLQRAFGALQRVNRWLHYLAGVVLLLILAVTVVNIFGRRFNQPLAGSVEMTQLFMGLMVFLALSYGEGERVHISVDLLYERLGDRGKKVLRIFGRLVGLVIVVFLIRELWDYSNVQRDGLYTTAIRQWPIWPFVRAAAVGTFMLALTMVANLIADILNVEGFAETGEETEIERAI